MFWTRLPSLNALAQIPAPRFWKQWLREPLASADTLGRVPAGLYADQLRQNIFLVYQQLKRNKALPDHQGIGLAVLDGHESHASYRRHCAGCLQRTLSNRTRRSPAALSPPSHPDVITCRPSRPARAAFAPGSGTPTSRRRRGANRPALAAARFGALPSSIRLAVGRCALRGGSLFQLPADAPQTRAGGAEAGTS